jgi:N-acetyllactosaminide beta-1,3-N-acetylglucosaminyltransferase
MIAAGYHFQVLSPVFSCHWGLQTVKGDYNPWRMKQVAINMELAEKFQTEVNARYANVNRTC